MDIAPIVATDYEEVTPETPVSKLVGIFEDPTEKGVVVTDDGAVEGVVTRRQLAASHHPPDEKAGSLVWHVPRVARHEDVRAVAGQMLDADVKLLPVVEGTALVGVVSADDVLEAVLEFLDAATVAQAAPADPVTVDPETTFGTALHLLREHRISHLPVVEDDSAVGILSLHDVLDLSARAVDRSQGGQPGEFGGTGRSHGGFGERSGDLERILDLPVRDLMVEPVRTIGREETLRTAVSEMFDVGGSALVVVDDGAPEGIVTKSDVLRSLTWGTESTRAVQVYGVDLLDDITYEEVVDMVDGFDDMDAGMAVLDARIHLHEHDERLRGTPLLLARIRLWTDRGLYMASGEGYGASHAIHEARDVLERRIRDDKTRGASKKHPDETYWERRFGWWLEGAE